MENGLLDETGGDIAVTLVGEVFTFQETTTSGRRGGISYDPCILNLHNNITMSFEFEYPKQVNSNIFFGVHASTTNENGYWWNPAVGFGFRINTTSGTWEHPVFEIVD